MLAEAAQLSQNLQKTQLEATDLSKKLQEQTETTKKGALDLDTTKVLMAAEIAKLQGEIHILENTLKEKTQEIEALTTQV
jgi:predicted RNase H-like nuclease (RuvC/YqgF family)